jgi:hypothetical protein
MSLCELVSIVALGCVCGGIFLWSNGAASGDGVVQDLMEESGEGDHRVVSLNEPNTETKSEWITWWIFGAVIGVFVSVCLTKGGVSLAFLYGMLGCCAGELARRGGRDRARRGLSRRLEFYLPTAMERVVMAVGSGLDIVPALSEAARKSEDPVSDIFRSIVSRSEGGLRVEYAIQIAADTTPSTSVKHALMHLALAYSQGGEVVRPLKELSDATQTHYQESVEEEIARLPVRAVLPLLLTFTGLIICFLTVPVVQVGASLERFSHATK